MRKRVNVDAEHALSLGKALNDARPAAHKRVKDALAGPGECADDSARNLGREARGIQVETVREATHGFAAMQCVQKGIVKNHHHPQKLQSMASRSTQPASKARICARTCRTKQDLV
jgi:hypothetical protein